MTRVRTPAITLWFLQRVCRLLVRCADARRSALATENDRSETQAHAQVAFSAQLRSRRILRVTSILTLFPLPTVKRRRNAFESLPTKPNSNVRAARLSFVPWSTTAALFSCISPLCPASYSSLVRSTTFGSGPNAAPSSLGTQGTFYPPPLCHFRVFPQVAQVKRAPKALAALSAYVTAP